MIFTLSASSFAYIYFNKRTVYYMPSCVLAARDLKITRNGLSLFRELVGKGKWLGKNFWPCFHAVWVRAVKD